MRLPPWSRGPTAAFAGTRAVNGGFALASTALPIAVAGASEAGRYFALWTAGWLCAVVARFGIDMVLPRVVAERGEQPTLGPVRRRSLAGALCAVLAVVPICAVLGAPVTATTVSLVAACGLLWGRTFVLAGLLRAHRHVVASGVVTNVIWSSVGLVGPAVAWLSTGQPTATEILAGTAACSTLALLTATIVVRRMLASAPRVPIKASTARDTDETVAAAVLAALVEVATWSPMVFAGLLGLDAAATAAVFAAARVAGVASWGYQAVVATAGPPIALAIARRDAVGLRRRVRRARRVGSLVTFPVVLVGLVVAEWIVALFVAEEAPVAGDVLRLLLLARLFDAVTGPVGEAFVVGRRVCLDAGLVAAGLAAGAVLSLFLPADLLAAGLLAAGAAVATNALRVALFERKLALPLLRAEPA